LESPQNRLEGSKLLKETFSSHDQKYTKYFSNKNKHFWKQIYHPKVITKTFSSDFFEEQHEEVAPNNPPPFVMTGGRVQPHLLYCGKVLIKIPQSLLVIQSLQLSPANI